MKSIDSEQQNLYVDYGAKSKILWHLNIEQRVSNISTATISDLPVNLLLFVAVFQNVDSFGGELYMQRIFWTLFRSLGNLVLLFQATIYIFSF